MSNLQDWETIIGLEIHAQLNTRSKMFSPDSAQFGGGDNEHIDSVSFGLPGALPVVNQKAIEFSIKTGLALNCEIQSLSIFSRKNYFYPDLPKGYQISQYDKPLCTEGYVEFYLDGNKKKVRIERAHMEEDAGKSVHAGGFSLVNLNRSGVPLLEIVSGPDMRSPQEAAEYSRTVRKILRYLGVCDGNLEEGSMRCDCNVSVRRRGAAEFGTKVELKNINSFRFIEKAIAYEVERQIATLEGGGTIVQETRLYDSTKNQTFSMRLKEEAQDYRYFPDPDLLPLRVESSFVEQLRLQIPELPLKRAERFQSEFGLPEYDSFVLTEEKDLADFFEEVANKSKNAKSSSNWIMTEFLRNLNEEKKVLSDSPINSDLLAEMIRLIDDGTLSGKMAKQIFQEMWKSGKAPSELIKDLGLTQITDEGELLKIIDAVIANNPQQAADYRNGKDKLFGFFVGQVMKLSKGQAAPEKVNQLLMKRLKD